MGKLSSETLFHFVSEKRHLIDILNNNFRPRYVVERFPFLDNEMKEMGIPMLCFCDIRLSNVDEHTDWYGEYGIGMKSTWATKNGMTPVQYYNKESYLVKELGSGISKLKETFINANKDDLESSTITDYYFSIFMNVWYMKEYKGKQWKWKTEKEILKKFYDEKEWRYIPKLSELKGMKNSLPITLLGKQVENIKSDSIYKEQINGIIRQSLSLNFNPDDISNIIIAKESERLEFINALKRSKEKYNKDEITILTSKIISLEQIKNDF